MIKIDLENGMKEINLLQNKIDILIKGIEINQEKGIYTLKEASEYYHTIQTIQDLMKTIKDKSKQKNIDSYDINNNCVYENVSKLPKNLKNVVLPDYKYIEKLKEYK